MRKGPWPGADGCGAGRRWTAPGAPSVPIAGEQGRGQEVPRRPVTGPYGEAGGALRAVAPGAGGPPGQPAGGPGRGEGGGERDWRGVRLRQLTMGREESALGGAGGQKGRGAGVPPGRCF